MMARAQLPAGVAPYDLAYGGRGVTFGHVIALVFMVLAHIVVSACHAGPVTVREVRRLKEPAQSDPTAWQGTDVVAWSTVTDQIAAGPYLFDPSSARVIRRTSAMATSRILNGSMGTGPAALVEPGLLPAMAWSRRQPVLVSGDGKTLLITQTGDPSKAAAGRPLEIPQAGRFHGLELVSLPAEELIVLAVGTEPGQGGANLVAVDLNGATRREWTFPDDGRAYRLTLPALSTGLKHGQVFAALNADVYEPAAGGGAFVSKRSNVLLVNLSTGKTLCSFDTGARVAAPPSSIPSSPRTAAIGLSPDGRWFVASMTAGRSTDISVYGTDDCRPALRLETEGAAVPDRLTFSHDAKWLLGVADGGGGDGLLFVWRTSDWKLVHRSKSFMPQGAAFSRSSSRFAIGTFGGVRIFEILEN